MKINMSEELHFDELEFNDGSEAKEDAEKEAEKSEKEVQKEIDQKIKDVEEINEAEPEEFKDDSTKDNSKVRELKEEKLTLDESDLDEAIPKDLAQAYKRSGNGRGGYKGAANADLQKATYQEVTPEEAYKIYKDLKKNGDDRATTLRIVLGGKVIKIWESDAGFRDQYVSTAKAQQKKNGGMIRDTRYMSPKHLFEIADKIYVTNEAEPEGQKDASVMAARAQNPESPNFVGDYGYSSYAPNEHSRRGRSLRRSMSKSDQKYAQERRSEIYSDYSKNKKNLESQLNNGTISQTEYDSLLSQLKNNLSNRLQNDWYVNRSNDETDAKARRRYYDAEKTISEPRVQYDELKNSIDNAQRNVTYQQSKVDKIKNSGSDRTARTREDIAYYERQLRDISKRLARLELQLETADETDAAELASAEQQLNDYVATLDANREALNKLLRKTEGIGDIYDKIEKNNLVEDFEDIMESLYPQGYTADDMISVLKDNEMITEMLDLE